MRYVTSIERLAKAEGIQEEFKKVFCKVPELV
jgi:hypothetical protein